MFIHGKDIGILVLNADTKSYITYFGKIQPNNLYVTFAKKKNKFNQSKRKTKSPSFCRYGAVQNTKINRQGLEKKLVFHCQGHR